MEGYHYELLLLLPTLADIRKVNGIKKKNQNKIIFYRLFVCREIQEKIIHFMTATLTSISSGLYV